MPDLHALLHSTFGHTDFRANQEAVCRALVAGRDCLLVMPTGAGKSLCYQLPVIARGGTGLVISPLIALMDDQAQKLSAAGLKVARIHSGLSRDQSRQACRDYLDGNLQFLFIAPERMRVPGFPEMLARRKPCLIAIDEAHCISAWGHDFRPDYRTLGDHLPALRPAPIIALTATATPTVQKDIAVQLNLQQPALFIHGFRRDNLHIEVLELSKPQRTGFISNFLADPTRRPAIVYAPSRKAAEELAADLNKALKPGKDLGAPGLASETWARAASYHAGLPTEQRERVQQQFQSGKLEIVVATIAFGMGIDKADVRTVIHAALPGSVEAYYQEIGRAGRDALPSRTVLLYSFQDRKMHEFFFERDYPVVTELTRVNKLLTEDFLMPDILRQQLKMDAETFDKAVEKLVSQGAAITDFNGNVRRGSTTKWQSGYELQVQHRRSQIDRMMEFAQAQQCRMTALIRHFGDTADAHRPCGHCDFCAPLATTAQTFGEPTAAQEKHLRTILRTLAAGSKSTGKLHTELALTKDRKDLDGLLDGLARAGLITLNSEQFTNPEGTLITFKKAALTHEGRELTESEPLGVLLRSIDPSTPGPTTKKKKTVKAAAQSSAAFTPAQENLEAALRAWRKQEAGKTGKPAFMVFGDAALQALVIAAPKTLPELLTVSGFGPAKTELYGAAITAICRNPDSDAPPLASPPSKVDVSAESRPFEAKQLSPPPRRLPTPDPSAKEWKRQQRLIAEDFTYLKPSSSKGRARSREYSEAVYRRLDFEADLRLFAQHEGAKMNTLSEDLLSEAALAEILRMHPRTLEHLKQLSELRGDLPQNFYKGLLSVCTAEYKSESSSIKQPILRQTAVDNMRVRQPSIVQNANQSSTSVIKERTSPIQQFGEPTPTFHRDRPTPADPNADLTPTQQALDLRLRAWRKSESEKIGLPQFFVLGTSTLRSIVLKRPSTLDQLKTITGIDAEKLTRFGPSILELCNT